MTATHPPIIPSGSPVPVAGWPVRGMMAGEGAPATRTGAPAGKADWAALGTPAGNGTDCAPLGADCAPPETVLPRTTLITGVPYAEGGSAPLDPEGGTTLLGGKALGGRLDAEGGGAGGADTEAGAAAIRTD